MPELPKSAIARMKAQAAPKEHPDADLLAAFSEQALTGRERENVLAHLAACPACREVVALAAPEAAATQPVRTLVPWYRRPRIFAAAGTLATLALMAALLLDYGRNQHAPRTVTDAMTPQTAPRPSAENKPAAPEALDKVANGSLGRLTTPKESPARRDVAKVAPTLKATPEQQSRREMAAAPSLAQTPAKDQKKLDGGTLQSQYSVLNAPAAVPPPPPPPAARAQDQIATKQQARAASQAVTVESAEAVRAGNADITANAGSVGGVAGGAKAKMAEVATAPTFLWSISDKGKLRRSLDSGRSWQEALANEPTVFRALAVVGNQVWAGGTGPVVFHSADAGAHWTKQTLPGASSDVVSLEFTDFQNGRSRTADGIAWSTSDGGQHWTKQ